MDIAVILSRVHIVSGATDDILIRVSLLISVSVSEA